MFEVLQSATVTTIAGPIWIIATTEFAIVRLSGSNYTEKWSLIFGCGQASTPFLLCFIISEHLIASLAPLCARSNEVYSVYARMNWLQVKY
jgi:hypothetical protein